MADGKMSSLIFPSAIFLFDGRNNPRQNNPLFGLGVLSHGAAKRFILTRYRRDRRVLTSTMEFFHYTGVIRHRLPSLTRKREYQRGK
jgi:hypothetical protein